MLRVTLQSHFQLSPIDQVDGLLSASRPTSEMIRSRASVVQDTLTKDMSASGKEAIYLAHRGKLRMRSKGSKQENISRLLLARPRRRALKRTAHADPMAMSLRAAATLFGSSTTYIQSVRNAVARLTVSKEPMRLPHTPDLPHPPIPHPS